MTSWIMNETANLYNAVPAPAETTRDTPPERLQSLPKTASLLYVEWWIIFNMDERDQKTS